MEINPLFLDPTPNTKKAIEFRFDSIQEEKDINDEVFSYKNSVAFFKDLYQIKGFLGYGAFGLVLGGIEKGTQRPCAIKIIKKNNFNTEGIHTLRSEAFILASLKHKNIVEYYNIHESERILIIVMELLHGGSLQQFIKTKATNNECFNPRVISNIMKQILEALQYIHSKNIIHNDIKPANIMLKQYQSAKIIKIADFGVSTVLDNSLNFYQGNIKGTIAYMAPEQLNSKLATKFVDIWAAGIILFILFTNRHPFYSPNDTKETVYQNILRGPEFPSKFPKTARNFFSKLCAIQIESRLDASSALKHPFLTGKKSESEPLTLVDEIFYLDNISKFKQVQTIMFLLGFTFAQSNVIINNKNPNNMNISTNIQLNPTTKTNSINSRNQVMNNTFFPLEKQLSMKKNSISQFKNIHLDNESDLNMVNRKDRTNSNFEVNTPKYTKRNLVLGEDVKLQYQKSTFSSKKNAQRELINIKSQSKLNKLNIPIQIKPVKALPSDKKEIKKSTFYSNPTGQDLLKKIENEVLEEIKCVEKRQQNKGVFNQGNLPTLKRAQSSKNNILIRPPKLKGFVERNIKN